MAQLRADFPDDVRIIYRHFPLNSHDKAALATQAAEAAGQQGEFWAMHDLLFQRQSEWASLSVEEFQTWVIERAGDLALDGEQFAADLTSEEIEQFAQDAWEEGVDIGIPGTPLMLINRRIYTGPRDFFNLATIVELLRLEERQYPNCPPVVIDPLKQYVATLETEKGDVVIELLPEEAPLAVNNFVFLARNDWYDGVTFHRVIEDFVAQAGDPSGTGFGNPGYAFKTEISENLSFNQPGIVGMANSGPDTNGSQFFISLAPVSQLDGGYTIFGRVLEGMDVLYNITARDPSQNANLPPGDTIIRVTVEEK